MVSKDKDRGKVKVDPLKINTETVQDLTEDETGKVRGGFLGGQSIYGACTQLNCPTEYANCTVSPRADCLGQPGPKDPPPQDSNWCK